MMTTDEQEAYKNMYSWTNDELLNKFVELIEKGAGKDSTPHRWLHGEILERMNYGSKR